MTSDHIRPGWDTYFLNIAHAVSSRADCTRRKVGAVLAAADHSIISTGYNGGPSKGLSCLKGECPRGRLTHSELPPDSPYDTGGGTCVALHAEWNVLLRASWAQMIDATLYVTEEPCHICKSLIGGTQIASVVWPSGRWKPGEEAALQKSMDAHPAGKKSVLFQCRWHVKGTQFRCTQTSGHSGPCY